MLLPGPTLVGTIQRRYKRFFADILVDGKTLVAHVPNTGSMATCWRPGWKALVSVHDNPKRKLPYTLEMTHNGETWIGVNTRHPNTLAQRAVEEGLIGPLRGYERVRPEHRVGASRIDLLLESDSPGVESCFVEVKNVTLLGEKKTALFPDAVTLRGQKHLRELTTLKRRGHRAVMLFVVQREDVTSFSVADSLDPTYGRLLREALDSGVEVLAYRCRLTTREIALHGPLKVDDSLHKR